MRSTVTMSTRSLFVSGLVLLALVVAHFVGSAQPDSSRAFAGAAQTQSAEDTTTEHPTIMMTGEGEATGVPDQLAFDVTISVTRPDVTTALDEANQTARRVLEALEGQGIGHADVKTTGLAIRPVYHYSDGSPVLDGYAATERLGVLATSLRNAGKALSATAQAGGNAVQIHGVRLQIGDKDALLTRARDAAVVEATAKAKQYAEATGSDLGPAISIREVSARLYAPVAFGFKVSSTMAALSKVPIRAGSSETSVTVAITWSLG